MFRPSTLFDLAFRLDPDPRGEAPGGEPSLSVPSFSFPQAMSPSSPVSKSPDCVDPVPTSGVLPSWSFRLHSALPRVRLKFACAATWTCADPLRDLSESEPGGSFLRPEPIVLRSHWTISAVGLSPTGIRIGYRFLSASAFQRRHP